MDDLLTRVENEIDVIDRELAAEAANHWGFDGRKAPKWAKDLMRRRAAVRDAEDLLREVF